MAITVSEFTPASGTGTQLQVTKTVTAGSTIVVVGSSTEAAAAPTCSDGTNTYTQREQQTHASSGIRMTAWSATNVAGGSTTITLGNLAGYQGTLHAFEILDADTTASYEDSDNITQSVTSVYFAQAAGLTISTGGIAIGVLIADRDIVGLTCSGYTNGTTVNTSSIYAYPVWQVFASGASGERAAGTLTSNGHTNGVLFAIKAAAAASGYTLTCDQGSYSVTGQAAGLQAGHKLAAAQGSYTITGSAATLIEGHVLPAESGGYTITGSAAYADFAITCAAGSYALTGQDSGLLAGLTMTAEQGSYSITGQDAGTLVARIVAAGQGSYALTGQDAALTYTPAGARVLTADQGGYTLTGQSVAALAARYLTAAQGSLTITGQAMTPRVGRGTAAAAGSYTLTGQDIAIDVPLRLVAAQGSYAITGQTVALTYAGAPAAVVLSAPPIGRRLQTYGRHANVQRTTR